MGARSSIEWTTHTFNPWIGCTKVSPGCAKCYAAARDRRFRGGHWGPGAPRQVTSPGNWAQPARWDAAAARAGRRDRVFCASLADVFDAEAPPGALERLWGLVRTTPSLDWLILTKRPERIRESLPRDWDSGWSNVWLGTSVEDQARADERIPILLTVPARVRFLSCEPLLGPIDLRRSGPRFWRQGLRRGDARLERFARAGAGPIHWAIAGGESGPGARRCDDAWVRSLRDQSIDQEIAFFFKQWGTDVSNPEIVHDATAKRRGGATKGGRLLDGRTWDDLPSPALEVPP